MTRLSSLASLFVFRVIWNVIRCLQNGTSYIYGMRCFLPCCAEGGSHSGDSYLKGHRSLLHLVARDGLIRHRNSMGAYACFGSLFRSIDRSHEQLVCVPRLCSDRSIDQLWEQLVCLSSLLFQPIDRLHEPFLLLSCCCSAWSIHRLHGRFLLLLTTALIHWSIAQALHPASSLLLWSIDQSIDCMMVDGYGSDRLELHGIMLAMDPL
jgi:hypothetical protein